MGGILSTRSYDLKRLTARYLSPMIHETFAKSFDTSIRRHYSLSWRSRVLSLRVVKNRALRL